jgi:septal ring factor EnvC (AmiA/AmiB activator)
MDNEYKITAISFSDEVNDTDMVNMDDIWNEGEQDQDLNLLYLYRYYYKDTNHSKQRMKDTKALRDALSNIEQKNKMLKTYETSLLTQDKRIDELSAENQQLRSRIEELQSGKTDVQKSPRDPPPKKEYTAILLPKNGSKPTKPEAPVEVVPK